MVQKSRGASFKFHCNWGDFSLQDRGGFSHKENNSTNFYNFSEDKVSFERTNSGLSK